MVWIPSSFHFRPVRVYYVLEKGEKSIELVQHVGVYEYARERGIPLSQPAYRIGESSGGEGVAGYSACAPMGHAPGIHMGM